MFFLGMSLETVLALVAVTTGRAHVRGWDRGFRARRVRPVLGEIPVMRGHGSLVSEHAEAHGTFPELV